MVFVEFHLQRICFQPILRSLNILPLDMFRYLYDSPGVSSSHNPAKAEQSLSPEGNLMVTADEVRRDTIGSPDGPERRVAHIKSPLDQKHRGILYADYTASGRALNSIEAYIHDRVLPWYGNTHSVASGTARQSTHFREEARYIIRNYFNCTEANAIIFTGAGVTGAVTKFLNLIQAGVRDGSLFNSNSGSLRSFLVEDRWGSLMCSLCDVRVKNEAMFRSHCNSSLHHEKLQSKSSQEGTKEGKKICILIDNENHHSAMLPFRELAKQSPATFSTRSVSRSQIASLAADTPNDTLVIAIVSAMSNITGEGTSVEEISKINEAVHAVNGLVAWDLATYASHYKWDMNPVNRPRAYSDFAFVSTHKLIGGPGSSGLLLARREWLKNSIPTIPGGGVIFFASEAEQSYIQNSQEREEAGTPDIVGCIRAGLVFALHSRINMALVSDRERSLSNILRKKLRSVEKILLLGNPESSANSSSIVSFNLLFNNSLVLHHNFVVTVLNDLFGIQARGGCACAGPLAQKLLGLDEDITHRFHVCLQQSGQEVFRPGFVRLGVHWTMREEEVELMGNAIDWIAKNGWRLLSVYSVDLETGEWSHRISNRNEERDWLSLIEFEKRDFSRDITPEAVKITELIATADKALTTIHDAVALESVRAAAFDQRFKDLVWFALPMDSKKAITDGIASVAMDSKRIVHPTTFMIAQNMVDSDEEAKLARPSEEPTGIPSTKRQKKFQVPKKLRALVTSALVDYSMLKEGDRVLIGVSGGKDSLSLLHILLECQRKCPFRFEIACATVDPQVPEYQPEALIGYMESLGVKYYYLSQPIVELAKRAMTGKQSICAFCSRMKRGMLYGCMRENGYNVLALGQHLDDLVESFLMSCFRNGSLRTMKANYFVKEKDLRVIRPLIYVRERMTNEFATDAQLPIIRDNCPACFAAPKERHRVKMLLSNEEFQNPHLFASMLQAMKPLIGISSALSTRELIACKSFPIANEEEDDDQAAEDVLLPCSVGVCPIPSK